MDSFASQWKNLTVPNAPRTPNRSVRVPEDLWVEAKRLAAEQGETVTEVIVRCLRQYVADGQTNS
jgi:hypothetical protein